MISIESFISLPIEYEFLQDIDNRRYVAELLAKEIIKDKEILTTREFLNFIYVNN